MQLRGELDFTYKQACLYLTYNKETYSFKNLNKGQRGLELFGYIIQVNKQPGMSLIRKRGDNDFHYKGIFRRAA